MSPVKRPSAVAGMKSGLRAGQAEAGAPIPAAAAATAPAPAAATPKPVRVTLNIPPELHRQLRKWTDYAADAIGAPQVSQQDAMRAMLTAMTLDKSIGLVVIDLLRREQP